MGSDPVDLARWAHHTPFFLLLTIMAKLREDRANYLFMASSGKFGATDRRLAGFGTPTLQTTAAPFHQGRRLR